MHFGAGAQQRQCGGDERLLDGEDQSPDEQRGEQCAAEVVHHLILVSGPVRLRDQPGGRHAQKAEGPVDGVEKDASHGNAAQRCRAGQMAGEDGVHHGEQRLGQVRKNERDGQQKDSPVPVGHFHGLVGLGFHIGCCFAIRPGETGTVAGFSWAMSIDRDSACPAYPIPLCFASFPFYKADGGAMRRRSFLKTVAAAAPLPACRIFS